MGEEHDGEDEYLLEHFILKAFCDILQFEIKIDQSVNYIK